MLYSSGGPFICFLRLALPVNRKSPIPTGSAPRREKDEKGGRKARGGREGECQMRRKKVAPSGRKGDPATALVLFQDTRPDGPRETPLPPVSLSFVSGIDPGRQGRRERARGSSASRVSARTRLAKVVA